MYYLLIELSYLVQVTYGSNGRCRHHRCDKKTADSSDVKLGTVITFRLGSSSYIKAIPVGYNRKGGRRGS